MKLKELIKYEDYDCPIVEFYDTDERLVFMVNLRELDFWDIDVCFDNKEKPYGVIMLKQQKNEEAKHDD